MQSIHVLSSTRRQHVGARHGPGIPVTLMFWVFFLKELWGTQTEMSSIRPVSRGEPQGVTPLFLFMWQTGARRSAL